MIDEIPYHPSSIYDILRILSLQSCSILMVSMMDIGMIKGGDTFLSSPGRRERREGKRVRDRTSPIMFPSV